MHASTIFGSEYILMKILLGDWQKEYKLRSDMCLSEGWPKSTSVEKGELEYFLDVTWKYMIETQKWISSLIRVKYRSTFEFHMEFHGENQFHGNPSFIHALLHQEILLPQQVPHVHSLMVRITAVSYLYISSSWNNSKVSYIAWSQKFHSI